VKTTKEQRLLADERRKQHFVDWVDAMRLRASMRQLVLGRISEEEWQEYDRPTAPCPPVRKLLQ